MAMPTNILALPLAHIIFDVSNNADWVDSLVVLVSDSGTPPEQMDLRGIAFEMHLRRRPELPEIVLSASTADNTLLVGSPPDVGYLLFYVREETMRSLWQGQYVGDIRASDGNFERIFLTVDLTILEGITR
jgi:hypothetical protein